MQTGTMIVLTTTAALQADWVPVSQRKAVRALGSNALALPAEGVPLDALRADLAAEPVDVNPYDPKAGIARLLIADMDSTIITCECIDEVADFAGVKPQVSAITERAMRGEIDFEGALTERVALLKGLPVAELEAVFAERVRLSPGARTLVRTMRSMGAVTALVSGGFTFFSERVASAAGFEFTQANVLEHEGGRLTGTVTQPILGREAKAEALARFCQQAGISPADAVAVGDGANDLAMLKKAGRGVAYRAKPVVSEQADIRLDHSDLTAILSLQGIEERDFVTD
ncbi:MAG: phosphoserine phosphatase SerB [Pseudomonadota bacterium]